MATPSVFDLASAQRIAAAVRKVEIGDRSESALRFRSLQPQQQRKVFRIATFTGSWAIGETKSVQYKYVTSTPNTASVLNLFFQFPDVGQTADCAIARDGTSWFLVDVPFQTATAVFSGVAQSTTVISGITISAVLNTSNCDITVTTTQETASVTLVSSTFTSSFVRFGVT
jgi:hypothetical protein